MSEIDTYLLDFLKQNKIEIDEDRETGFIDTGSYALNGLLSASIYGGYPDDRVTALAGEEATGKTFLALSGVKEFLDTDKNNYCLYFESEHSVTRQTLEKRDIPPSRCVPLGINTVEEWRNRVSGMLDGLLKSPKKDGKKFMMVLDSLGNLPSEKELTDSINDKDTADMTRSKQVRSAFRTVTRRLGKLGIPLIVVNHTYEVIGAWSPNKNSKVTTMGGGGGLKYAASTIIYLSKKKDYDEIDKMSKGILITARLEKSRFSKPDKKVQISLSFDKGVDRYHGLLQVALDDGILTKRSAGNKGTIIVMPDGTSVPLKDFNANPEKYWTPDLLDKVDATFKRLHSLGAGEAVDDDELDADEGDEHEVE